MRRAGKRMAKLILGWSFIVLGVLGLVLPVLQGVLFIAIGLAILAQEQDWAHRLLHRLRHRFPHMAQVFDRSRHKAEAWVYRLLHRAPPPQRIEPPPPLEPPDGPRA